MSSEEALTALNQFSSEEIRALLDFALLNIACKDWIREQEGAAAQY